MTTGRFAPSPTGSLHLGNLRTALLAWLFARHDGGRFLIRVEDLTTGAAPSHEAEQLGDLAALGLTSDGPVVRQSDRASRYDAAVDRLVAAGLTYPCYCSRREVREAAAAPHGPFPEGAYPGTCRSLDARGRRDRQAAGRRPALRLRADGAEVTVTDRLRGELTGVVDDFVLRRADGVAAYNLAVVVDDAAQGIDQVVRGDDLWDTTPRQVLLARLLGLGVPRYAHVPLAVDPHGRRLAKRDGAATLSGRRHLGQGPAAVLALLGASLGLCHPTDEVDTAVLLAAFDPDAVPREPWVLDL